MRKYIIQLIESETGKRSEPFTVTKETYRTVLDAVLENQQEGKKYGVLVTVESDNNNELVISNAPLMGVEMFKNAMEQRDA